MKTLDSILGIAKAVSGTVGAVLAGLLGTGVIPVPEAWRGALTTAAVFLTGFSVWLTSNGSALEADVNKVVAVVDAADPKLAPYLGWAETVQNQPAPDPVPALPDPVPAP